MCEMLVRVVDKTNDQPYNNVQLLKRGDVVVVMDDGHGWGGEELRNPEWRIVKLPNVSTSAAQVFLGPELDTDPGRPSLMLQARGFGFDLSMLPSEWLADDSRQQPMVTLDASDVSALKVRKTAQLDPNIL